MKIKKLEIENIGGIKNLNLNFNDRMNVICGTNGIGKTTILDTIVDAFSYGQRSRLKRNSLANFGKYNLLIEENKETKNFEKEIKEFTPIRAKNSSYDLKEFINKILFFGIDRNIPYIQLDSIKSDQEVDPYEIGGIINNGIKITNAKNWFINRFAFHDKEDSLDKIQIENFKFSKNIFSLLDDTIKFKTVKGNSYDIILSTSKGDIYFEYLSSGYKSCIYIILGIIKELEYRYSSSPIKVIDFDGVILIDELDLHLHPIWQAELVSVLKKCFPKAQFIVTTHSPNLLQSLKSQEIIALCMNENNNIMKKELNLGKYGLQGWTVEEILKNVMGMADTSSKFYLEILTEFDRAMNEGNQDKILENYRILKEMLHPDNLLNKLLDIQVAEWKE